MQEIKIVKTNTPKQKPMDENNLGFGQIFTDHMLIMNYDEGKGWHDMRVVPFEDFKMSPASVVLHYGQAIFEGMKCYRTQDGQLRLFRPRDNFARMNRSAERMCMPKLDEEQCLAGLLQLLQADKDWVPHTEGTSLYIRPTIIASDVHLGVHASKSYTFFIILSPSGAYYKEGLAPVKIYVEDQYVRAVRGGIGFTKAAANYAASLYAGSIAENKGYSQVLWLDGVEQRYIEEVGSMNIMFVIDGKIVTPMLNGSILPGITRDSILKLAKHLGYETVEKRISIDEIIEGVKSGRLTEAFGTGTAAVVSPVGELYFSGEVMQVGDGGIGKITQEFYDTLTGIQFGHREDPFGWIMNI